MSDFIPARELVFHATPSVKIPEHLAFVRENHYTHACPPGRYWFGATHEGVLIGAALFRKPSLPKTAKAYAVELELSRLVLLDVAGKNSESRFLGYMLRWLARNTDAIAVISFADPRAGHTGGIYRAANWEYLGTERGHGTRRIVVDGEELHSKTAYDRYGCSGSGLVAMLAPKKVEIVVCPPKHVYRYVLRGRK